ncbi:DUF429 domain-containing protein [Aporhodopirellula aestuarii]|uniref:DUF429 domain-containing protein n=1 Tax=Aporhodopirellula aestuarii TaxID=2950107 RepID=A0ABT0U884_9BACT|nr:DUF429 domain-containing protein [Aporhodopirellula aestuarii]MCM2373145.1 DUF429 domain-containing protein [Aporhodopirellula aestuarii]
MIVTGEENLVNATHARISRFQPQTIMGVDFSGAAQAGKNAWIAELQVNGGGKRSAASQPLKLVDLQPLGRAAGDPGRNIVCKYLAEKILDSRGALWGMDFPFGLPIELGLGDWPDQIRHVTDFDGDAQSYGRHLVKIARRLGDSMHIRRETDRETRTPFDCYHYRIIYQTFHGMRDVLARIAGNAHTLVMPFDSDRLDRGELKVMDVRRIVVEACPSSTLWRMSLPRQKYKQSGGKPPDEVRRKNRRVILTAISRVVEMSAYRRKVMMENPGGDALDAVIAAVGVWSAWNRDDHSEIARHSRYRQEGRVYC